MASSVSELIWSRCRRLTADFVVMERVNRTVLCETDGFVDMSPNLSLITTKSAVGFASASETGLITTKSAV